MRKRIAIAIAALAVGAGPCLADHIGANYTSRLITVNPGQKMVVALDCGNGFAPGKGGAYAITDKGAVRHWVQPLVNQIPLLDTDKDSVVGLAFSIANPTGLAQRVVVWQTCITDTNPHD